MNLITAAILGVGETLVKYKLLKRMQQGNKYFLSIHHLDISWSSCISSLLPEIYTQLLPEVLEIPKSSQLKKRREKNP